MNHMKLAKIKYTLSGAKGHANMDRLRRDASTRGLLTAIMLGMSATTTLLWCLSVSLVKFEQNWAGWAFEVVTALVSLVNVHVLVLKQYLHRGGGPA